MEQLVISTVKGRQRMDMNECMLTAQFVFNTLIQFRIPTKEMVPLMFRLGLPASINIIMTVSHRHIHRPV